MIKSNIVSMVLFVMKTVTERNVVSQTSLNHEAFDLWFVWENSPLNWKSFHWISQHCVVVE